MKSVQAVDEIVKKYSCADVSKIKSEMNIPESGLSDNQLAQNRDIYGANTLINKKNNSFLHCLRRAFISPFVIILFIIAIISLLTNLFSDGSYAGSQYTTIIICVMLLLSGIVRLFQELHSKKITDSLTSITSSKVNVYRGGDWIECDSEDIVAGDIISLKTGSRVPADIRITDATNFAVSQSALTGESVILEKNAQTLEKLPDDINGFTNIVFSGSVVTEGYAQGIVLAVGKRTLYGSISPAATRRKQSFDKGSNSIAAVLLKFMAILVPVVFLACGITKGNWFEAIIFALSVAVGLTPELLPMVVNACLIRGSARMRKNKTIVKNINAMQGFGSMNILCVDKTGTLTEDTVILEYYMDILGNESRDTLDYAYLNSYFCTSTQNHLDRAIKKCLDMPGGKEYYTQLTRTYKPINEIPFDYSRKYSGVVLDGKEGKLLVIKGDVDSIISRCNSALYKGKKIDIDENTYSDVHSVVDEMAEDGMKVLAVAIKHLDDNADVDIENGVTLVGYLAFFDAPKESACAAVKKLHDLHIRVKVLTGDEKHAAVSVCKRLEISTEHVLTGGDLQEMSPDYLPAAVEYADVFAELTPKQKAEVIKILQENGHSVGYLGDGMNDLAAELQADVSISVDTAVDAVRESADVILLEKDLNVLENSVIEGRKAFSNMTKYCKITSSSNFGNILAIVIASILLPFLPMAALQLLFLNLLYDTLCLVLPWDNVDSEMLARPYEWSGKNLKRFMLCFGPISTLFDIITFAFLYFVLCPDVCGGSYAALNDMQRLTFISLFHTGWFLESMWTQVAILHLLRTKKIPFAQSRPATGVTVITICGIILFTVLAITPVGELLGFTALPVYYFGFLAAVVVSYLLIMSAAKKLYIKRFGELL
ncbi:MAG: magnesium-translocating P-type ATPase [Clostridia bacterium]|nr:magnesium-translocating P-type ATPase [Clostridia bacterium]